MFKAFGLAVASEGFSLTQLRTELSADNATLTLGQIVAPRARRTAPRAPLCAVHSWTCVDGERGDGRRAAAQRGRAGARLDSAAGIAGRRAHRPAGRRLLAVAAAPG